MIFSSEYWNPTGSQVIKIALILLLGCITIPLIFFSQTLDDFIPKHIALIVDLLANERINPANNQFSQTPGFYILGSVIVLISGFSPEALLSFPIQLIPYLVVLFYLFYRFSGNFVVAAIVPLIDLAAGVTGTAKIFYWPHGVGTILFFLVLILILDLFRNYRRREFTILIMVVGISLVFLSYNYTALSLILLTIVALLSAFVYLIHSRYESVNRTRANLSRILLSCTIVIACVELGLSKFAYGSFIPTLQVSENFAIGSLEKFSISYLDPDLTANILSPIMVHYPFSISAISAIKYGLLALTILAYVLIVGKGFRETSEIENIDLVLISVIVMEALYSIPRTMIGGIMITAIWLPGLLALVRLPAIIRLPRSSRWIKTWAGVGIITLLILTFSYYGIFAIGGLIDRIDYRADGYVESNQWFNNKTDSAQYASDELTKNFKILHDMQEIDGNSSGNMEYTVISENSQLMSSVEAGIIAQLMEGNLNNKKYFILNNGLSRMSFENWIILQSWQNSETVVTSNHKIQKVYENSLLDIYGST